MHYEPSRIVRVVALNAQFEGEIDSGVALSRGAKSHHINLRETELIRGVSTDTTNNTGINHVTPFPSQHSSVHLHGNSTSTEEGDMGPD